MSIRIIKQGIADSIQDAGISGYQHLGINPAGVMDVVAASVANLLVGNDLKEAVMELHFPASILLFDEQAVIALCGADLGAMINDIPIPLNTPVVIEKNCVLQFTKLNRGARCYLAVKYGFSITQWMGSCSTSIKAKAGGFEGRYLMKHDEIHFRVIDNYTGILQNKDAFIFPWKADTTKLYTPGNIIRIITGDEFERLNDQSKKIFVSSPFAITTQSDRMGYRMKGEPLQLQQQQQIISTAVNRGTIQLLPDGQLILLMADHQTTGGYPRIGHIIRADLPKLAQMKPNQLLRFQIIAQQEAEDIFYEQHRHLLQLQNACNLRLQEYIQKHALH